MKLIVCGYGEHGKDAFCERLERTHGISYQSSSFAAKEEVYELSSYLQERYRNPQHAWENRRKSDRERKVWHDAIAHINADDPTLLATQIFSEADVYCGMRSIRELNACLQKWGNDIWAVWVDASLRKPRESESSNTITQDDCDFTIRNNRDEEQFLKKADKIFWRAF
jgi:hypothetical protein